MNNYYTLHSLVAELRYEISGKEIREVWSSRKDQIDFFFQKEPDRKLTFSAASPGTALFLDGRAAPPSHNAAGFFPELKGCAVAEVAMPFPHDRYIRFTFANSTQELLFMPFSSRPNVFLVEDGRILSSFKKSQELQGIPAPVAAGRVACEAAPHSLDPDLPLRKKITAIDKRFPRGLINDVADTCMLDSLDEAGLRAKLNELGKLLLHPETVSITAEGNLSLLPKQYLSHPPERTFAKVNDAVRTLFLSKHRETRLLPRQRDLEKKLLRRISGLRKQLDQLNRESERLEKANELEQAGHLLMSQPGSDRKVTRDRITVADWTDEGRERVISVTPGETLVHQAQAFYARAAHIRREIATSGKRKALVTSQLKQLEQFLEEVAGMEHPAELEKWTNKHEAALQQHGFATSEARPVARPYRLVKIGKYDVWIGKNAQSNDQILALSHKEDIWMHARGTTGSHVLIRTGGGSGWPDPQVILKAASFAAAYSRQAGSSMVPVMVAKRKHVRKPRGAAPGQVVVTRERVEMVRPQKPEAPES